MSRTPVLTKTLREQVRAVADVLEPEGWAYQVVSAGGGHFQVKVHGPRGGTWHVTLASSPRTDNAPHHVAQEARRLVRRIKSESV